MLDADRAFRVWFVQAQRQRQLDVGLAFKAGWQACIQALIDAGQIKLVVP